MRRSTPLFLFPILALLACETESTDSSGSEVEAEPSDTGSGPAAPTPSAAEQPGPSEMGPSEMGPSEMGPSEGEPSEMGPSEGDPPVAPTPPGEPDPETPSSTDDELPPEEPESPGEEPSEPAPSPSAPVVPEEPQEPSDPEAPVDGGVAEPETPVDPEPPGEAIACETPEEETFSFFLVSHEAIIRESGSPDGFGGDLGGIEGADAICKRVAEYSSPCAANATWRAFLSTTQEDAIDRIGSGPWFDRVGRLLANNTEELLNDRPPMAHEEIINDFPNEYGIPNHNPDGTGEVDNHQTLTGTGADGRLWSQTVDDPMEGGGGGGGFGGGGGAEACADGWTPEKATCWDWTSSEPVGCPRVGHSWPRFGESWISFWNEGGCAPGIILEELGGPNGDPTVGSAGGYGGFYCFAVTGEQ